MINCFSAFRANPFQYKRNGVGYKAFRQSHFGNFRILKAVGLLASFAVEMQMPVAVVVFPLMPAQLIMHNPPSVFERVHYIMLLE